jgi:hypothetical protein
MEDLNCDPYRTNTATSLLYIVLKIENISLLTTQTERHQVYKQRLRVQK